MPAPGGGCGPVGWAVSSMCFWGCCGRRIRSIDISWRVAAAPAEQTSISCGVLPPLCARGTMQALPARGLSVYQLGGWVCLKGAALGEELGDAAPSMPAESECRQAEEQAGRIVQCKPQAGCMLRSPRALQQAGRQSGRKQSAGCGGVRAWAKGIQCREGVQGTGARLAPAGCHSLAHTAGQAGRMAKDAGGGKKCRHTEDAARGALWFQSRGARFLLQQGWGRPAGERGVGVWERRHGQQQRA